MTQRPNADRYVVEGRGMFPLAMLDKDQSRPETDADQVLIDATFDDEAKARERRRVTLVTQERSTVDERWESFGWRVVRPLRPWSPNGGYFGAEPTQDVPVKDGRRMLTMHVICPDDASALRIEGNMRRAANTVVDVSVEPSCIEHMDVYMARVKDEHRR